jgi:hypothetical protein
VNTLLVTLGICLLTKNSVWMSKFACIVDEC